MDDKEKETVLYTEENLKHLTVPQLREIVIEKLDGKPHHNSRESKLIEQILNLQNKGLKDNNDGESKDEFNPDNFIGEGNVNGMFIGEKEPSLPTYDPDKYDLVEKSRNSDSDVEADKSTSEIDISLPEVRRSFDLPPSAIEAVSTIEKGIVKVEFINARRTGSLKVRDYTDSTGKKRMLRKAGEPWVFLITKELRLNLENEHDRALYLHLKDHPYNTNSMFKSIELVNRDKNAAESIDKEEKSMEAKVIVKQLNSKELRSFARVLGILNTRNVTDIVVKKEVYKKCDDNPDLVMGIWNSELRDIKILFYSALDKGVIKLENGVYKFNQTSMGTTEDQSILWISQNDSVVPGLRQMTI